MLGFAPLLLAVVTTDSAKERVVNSRGAGRWPDPHRQAELIRGLGINNAQEPASNKLKELMAAVAKRHGISMNNL